jgi:hypothetical protein
MLFCNCILAIAHQNRHQYEKDCYPTFCVDTIRRKKGQGGIGKRLIAPLHWI